MGDAPPQSVLSSDALGNKMSNKLARILLVSVLLLTACTSPPRPSVEPNNVPRAEGSVEEEKSTVIVSEGEMAAEFWETTRRLNLPEGARWPDKAPLLPPAPDPRTGKMLDNSYEKGYGRSAAEEIWFCTWQKEWLDARSGPRADAALKQLQIFKQTLTYLKSYGPEVRQETDQMLEKAALGDPTEVARNVELNCR